MAKVDHLVENEENESSEERVFLTLESRPAPIHRGDLNHCCGCGVADKDAPDKRYLRMPSGIIFICETCIKDANSILFGG